MNRESRPAVNGAGDTEIGSERDGIGGIAGNGAAGDDLDFGAGRDPAVILQPIHSSGQRGITVCPGECLAGNRIGGPSDAGHDGVVWAALDDGIVLGLGLAGRCQPPGDKAAAIDCFHRLIRESCASCSHSGFDFDRAFHSPAIRTGAPIPA